MEILYMPFNVIVPLQVVVMACSIASPMHAAVIGGVEIPADMAAAPSFNADPVEAIIVPAPDKGRIVVKPDHSVPPEKVGSYDDWAVFRGGDPAECWIASLPQASVASKAGKPVDVRRGDVRVFLTYQTGQPFEFSLESGYPIDKQSGAVLSVGDAKYRLDSESQTAWLEDQATADDLVASLRGAEIMKISAMSQRGTETEDTYSLLGLSEALAQAEQACAGNT